MSDLIGSLSNAVSGAGLGSLVPAGVSSLLNFRPGWLGRLRPASFRGAPFFVDGHDFSGGRRLVNHEFPLRDAPSVEDMGERQNRHRVLGYVISDQATQDYFPQRDYLRIACSLQGSAPLVHPYLGKLTVCCDTFKISETVGAGGIATFDIAFVDAGTAPSPIVTQDTSASLLSGINGVLHTAIQAYAIGSLVASRPSILLGLAEGLAGAYVASVLGLSPGIAAQLANIGQAVLGALLQGAGPVTSALTGLSGDPVAIAVTDLSTSAASLILDPPSAPAAPLSPSSPAALASQAPASGQAASVVGVTATASPMAADPSGGLAALCTFGTGLPAPFGLGAASAGVLQTTLVDLVRTAAVLAVAQIYANTDWITANAATAARAQLLGFLDERVTAAAAAAQDGLYQAWLSLTGLAMADLVQRAQALPSLTTYSMPRGLPACVIAQTLYQDGTRALELAALNNIPHPGFMPATGLALGQ